MIESLSFDWLVAAAALPSLIVAYVVGAIVRRVAARWGLVDQPGERKIHREAVPYGGGLAIWCGVVLPLAAAQILVAVLEHSYRRDTSGVWRLDFSALGEWGTHLAAFIEPHLAGLYLEFGDLWFLLGAGTVLMALGLVDDLRGLDWRFRLVIEVIVASAVVFGRGWQLTLFIDWPLLTRIVSVLWIVALVNAFNWLDNMDGLSAGVATIAALSLAVVMLLTHEAGQVEPQLFVAGFLFVLAGALVGFLLHNYPPARLYMGDAGAYFIGFCIAVITILATFSGGGQPRHAVLAPLCALAIPLYDMASVIAIRLRAGRSPFEADTNHFSHRLVALGLTKTQAVLTIYLASVACGLGAIVLGQLGVGGAVAVILMIGCLLVVIAILEMAARRKMRE